MMKATINPCVCLVITTRQHTMGVNELRVGGIKSLALSHIDHAQYTCAFFSPNVRISRRYASY